MTFDRNELAALKALLGDDGVRILSDTSFHTECGQKNESLSGFSDAQLLKAIRACFIGQAMAWSDIKHMTGRVDTLLAELQSRAGDDTKPINAEKKSRLSDFQQARRAKERAAKQSQTAGVA